MDLRYASASRNTFCLLLTIGTSLLVALSDCQIQIKNISSETMLCLDHRDKRASRQLSKCANVENPPTSTRKNRMMALLECLRRPFTLNKRLPGSLCPHQRIVGAFSRAETKPIKLGGKTLRVQSMLVCIKHWILRSFTLDYSAPCKTSVWSTLPWSVVVCFQSVKPNQTNLAQNPKKQGRGFFLKIRELHELHELHA